MIHSGSISEGYLKVFLINAYYLAPWVQYIKQLFPKQFIPLYCIKKLWTKSCFMCWIMCKTPKHMIFKDPSFRVICYVESSMKFETKGCWYHYYLDFNTIFPRSILTWGIIFYDCVWPSLILEIAVKYGPCFWHSKSIQYSESILASWEIEKHVYHS